MSAGLRRRVVGFFLDPADNPLQGADRAIPGPREFAVGQGAFAGAGHWAPPVDHSRVPAASVATSAALPASVTVLAAPRDGLTAGAALALTLAAAHRASCAVVCVWQAECAVVPDAIALPGAAALAARMRDAAIPATARGRLVLVELDADPGDAVAAAHGAAGAAGDVPLVTVLAGARTAAMGALLYAADRAIVLGGVGDPPELIELAATDAARVARATGTLRLAGGPVAAAAARSGWKVSPRLRAAALRALQDPA